MAEEAQIGNGGRVTIREVYQLVQSINDEGRQRHAETLDQFRVVFAEQKAQASVIATLQTATAVLKETCAERPARCLLEHREAWRGKHDQQWREAVDAERTRRRCGDDPESDHHDERDAVDRRIWVMWGVGISVAKWLGAAAVGALVAMVVNFVVYHHP